MRRKTRPDPAIRRRTLFYACAILAIMVYAIPRLPSLKPGLAGTFTLLWILFAGLAVAANLYFVFGADKERSRMLEEIAVYEAPSDAEEEQKGRRRAL
jgi:predicted anti-sigma-YlaC factor YlaD